MELKVDKTGPSSMPFNRLSVSEMFEALKAYERIGDYWTVSSMFKCSVDQVKAIVKHKQRLLDKYAVLPSQVRAKCKKDQRMRTEKIDLLDKTVFEWFLRARRNPSAGLLTHKLIKKIARTAQGILDINNFSVNHDWLIEFLQKYNITNFDMVLQSHDPGPLELNIKAIIAEVVEREKNDRSCSPSYETLNCNENDDSSASSTLPLSKNETLTRRRTSNNTPSSVNDEDPISTKSAKKMKHKVNVGSSNRTWTNYRLSFFDKLQVLKTYERIENYASVARLFNCGINQIKSAVLNKKKLLQEYESLSSHARDDYEESQRRRTERIVLLNKTVYEWFLRARRNRNEGFFSENFPLQKIALDVKKVLYVDNFFPDNDWLALFLQIYNIKKKSDMKLQPNDPNPLNLDIKAILADVIEKENIERPSSQNTAQTIAYDKKKLQFNVWDSFQWRHGSFLRATKISILGKVMVEWFLRARRNPSICPITDDLIKTTALDVKYILNIDDFSPNNAWLAQFRQRNNITDSDMELQLNESGPSDLDMEEIILKFVEKEENERPSSPSNAIVDCDDDFSASCSLPASKKATASISGLSDIQLGVELCEGSPSNEFANASKLHSDDSSDITGHIRLSLLSQVKVIEAYEETNNYSTVGRMFDSNAEDIKTIIDNKEKIWAMISSDRNLKRVNNKKSKGYKTGKYVRAKKIAQHDMVMFEWFLRARRNPSVCSITNKSILRVASIVKEALYIANFTPNYVWVSQFRLKHNITDVDMELRPNDPGPIKLDIRSIVRYVAEREKCNRPPSPPCDTKDSCDDSSASSKLSMSKNEPSIRSLTSDSDSSVESDEDQPSSESDDTSKAHSGKSRTNTLSLSNRVRAIEAYEMCKNFSQVSRMFKCDRRQITRIVDKREEILATFLSDRKWQTANKEINTAPWTIRFQQISLLGRVMYEWFLRARRNPSLFPISDHLIRTTARKVTNVLDIDDFYPNFGWVARFREKYNITDIDLNLCLNETDTFDLDIDTIIADVVNEEKNSNLGDSAPNPDGDEYLRSEYIKLEDDENTNESDKDRPSQYIQFKVDENEIEGDEELPSKYIKIEVDENEIEYIKLEDDGNTIKSDEELPSKYIKLEDDANTIESDEDLPSKYIQIEVDENENSDEDPPSKYIKIEVDENEIESEEDLPSKYIKLEVNGNQIECNEDPTSIYIKFEDDVIEIESDEDDDKSTETTQNTYAINNLQQALEHLKPLEEFAFKKEDYRLIGSISQLEMALKKF